MDSIVTIVNIINYLGEGKRPLKEGEEVLRAGMITKCGKIEDNVVVGLCLQTSKIKDFPHKVKLILNEDYRHCSCKAENGGKCKHIFAVLLLVNRTANLPELTCTYRFRANLGEWAIRNFISKILAASSSEAAQHITKNRKEFDINRSITNDEVKAALEYQLSLSFKTNFQAISLSEPKNEFYLKNVCLSMEDSVNLAQNTTDQSKSSLWHSAKKLRITASKSYELFTYTKNVSPNWINKISGIIDSNFFTFLNDFYQLLPYK
ncbi:hypothetical protein FQR65_LT14714 [Abscondita terminalis]|nr:hypothetical protein FQR65_LT14714 [Abscondita terminalis]